MAQCRYPKTFPSVYSYTTIATWGSVGIDIATFIGDLIMRSRSQFGSVVSLCRLFFFSLSRQNESPAIQGSGTDLDIERQKATEDTSISTQLTNLL
jgi:hypothetical protein